MKGARWLELELIDLPIRIDFHFDTFNNLWYHNLNYKSYLK